MLQPPSFVLRLRVSPIQLGLQRSVLLNRLPTHRWATTLPPPPPLPPSKNSKSGAKGDEDHTPKPLRKALGQLEPPRPGENSGIDHRSWRQRRNDFVNYESHLVRRKQLTAAVAKPYFREWSNMRFYKGKTFVAVPKLLRATKSLHFPNLQGVTLSSPRKTQDTTPTFHDRVSIVRVYSGTWAERQTATFTKNPELKQIIAENKGTAQEVNINIEENTMKAFLIRLFMYRIRKQFPKEDHNKYFLVRRGITDELAEAIGFLNTKVGYVYLVDGLSRIRWAGSGMAEPHEREGLIKCARRLVADWRSDRAEITVATRDAIHNEKVPDSDPSYQKLAAVH
ncbi:MAG: Mitochondrial ATPase complex subunit atp10 [Icmadophila ericetorum]|nr:Mitochondrial ATPase complex subunit atp10 [Icmadophila ericetorum]